MTSRSIPRIISSLTCGLFFATTISLFSQSTLRNRHSLLFTSAMWGGLVLLLSLASFLVIPLIYKKVKQFGKGNVFILVIFCVGMSALVLKTISASQLSFNNLMFFISISGSDMDKNKEIQIAEVKSNNQLFDLGNFQFMKGCRPTKNYPIICKGLSVIKYENETSDGTILPINILLFDQTRSDLISASLDNKNSFISLNNIYQNRSILFMVLWIDHRLIGLMGGLSLCMMVFCLLLFTEFSRNFQTGLNIFRIQLVLGLFTQLMGLVLVSKFFFSSSFLENLGFSKKNLFETVLGLLFFLLGELFYAKSRNKNNSVVLNFKSRIVFLWIPAFIFVFYAWTTFSSGIPDRENYFGYLSQAFSEQQLSLLILPKEKLLALADPYDPAQNLPYRLHVASLYKGKYYLYWGPVNTLIFYLPFYVFSGKLLPNDLACTLFGGGGFLFSVALLYQVRKKYYPAASYYGSALCIVVLGLSNLVPAVIRRPLYFEIAILGAFFWASLSIYLYMLALSREYPNIPLLFFSAVSYSLAFGNRINYILGCVIFIFPVFVIWKALIRKGLLWGAMAKVLGKYLLTVGLPLVIMLSLLLYYNYARFDSFFDFGINYQLDSTKNSDYILQDVTQIPYNSFLYFFLPVKINSFFPFFHAQGDNPSTVPSFIPRAEFRNCIGCKNVGMFSNTPFLWVVVGCSIALLCFSKAQPTDTSVGLFASDKHPHLIGASLLFIAFGNMYVVFQMFGHVLRYQLDFLPYILLASCIVFISFISHFKYSKMFYSVVSLCVLYSMIINISISIEGSEEPLLKTNAPVLYAAIRNGFDFVPVFMSSYTKNDDVRIITNQPLYLGKYYEYEMPANTAQFQLTKDVLTLKIFSYESGWMQIVPNYELSDITFHDTIIVSVTEIKGVFNNSFVVWPKPTPMLVPVKKGSNSYLLAFKLSADQKGYAKFMINGMDIIRK